jgi:glycosyltransferase involved in cell wall biosynthesis
MTDVLKNKVIMVKSNTIEREIRLPKEIAALNSSGYKIELLCWDRELNNINSTIERNFEEVSLKLKAPWGIRILLFLPIWWLYVFCHLLFTKGWDIVHASNFDSLVPSLIAAKIRRKPIIYEIVDVYADIILLPKSIRNMAIQIDKFLMRFVNAVIIIDDNQRKEFGGIPNSMIVTIYDTPPNIFGDNIITSNNEIFTIYYAGAFARARRMNLDKIVSAVETTDRVRLVISGYGDQTEEIKGWAAKNPDKITFLGFISHEEVFHWSCKADLLVVARSPSVIGNKFNCGSTVLRALMCGKPFLANKDTATADLVNRENCGISVEAYDVGEIKAAIIKLRDNPKLCHQYGQNAKEAYERLYKWDIMAKRLQNLYERLLNKGPKCSRNPEVLA